MASSPPSHPPLYPFPDRAIRWLLESPANVRALLRTVAPELAGRIDCDRLARLPRTFVLDTFRERESDCVFRVPYRPRDGSPEREVWIYVLLEHQSDPDAWMTFRLLGYMLALWEDERRGLAERNVPATVQRLTSILPVVLYTGRRPWEGIGSLSDIVEAPAELLGFLPRFDSVFFTVRGSEAEALTATGDPLGRVLFLFRLEDAPIEEMAEAVRWVFEGLEALAKAGETERWFRLAWVVVGYIRHRRPAEEVDRLLAAAREAIEDTARGQEVETMGKTSAEELIERGKEIGKQAGVVEAKRETLLRLLRARFGVVPETSRLRVLSIDDVARLDDLLERILTARSIEEMGL